MVPFHLNLCSVTRIICVLGDSGPGSRAYSPLGMTLYIVTEISFASVFGVVLICMIEYP